MPDFSSKPKGKQAKSPLAGITFTIDGVQFDCHGSKSTYMVTETARQARQGDESALAALTPEMFLAALGPEEYARFTDHIVKNETPDEVVEQIAEYINDEARKRVEARADRPTRQRSRSSSGPPEQGERMSRVISLQTGDVQVIAEEKTPKGKSQERATA